MTSSRTLRRSVAVLAGAATTAALTLIPSTGAFAGVAFTFEAVGTASASFTGSGGSCTLSSGDNSVASTPVAFNHGTKSRSAKLSATFTNSLNSSDQVTVTGKVSSSLTLKRKAGDLKSLDLGAKGSVTINHTVIGSQCRGTGQMFGEIPTATFTEHKKGTFAISYTTSKPDALMEFVLVNAKTGKPLIVTADLGDHTQGSASAKLKPGTYEIGMTEVGIFAGAVLTTKSASLSQKASMDVEVHATFTPKKKKH